MPVLYLGSDPARFQEEHKVKVIHFPILEMVPRSLDSPQIAHLFSELSSFTHTMITSKTTVAILREHLLALKNIFAIGKSTAAALEVHGVTPRWIAADESQEGMIKHLRLFPWCDEDYVFLPRSSLARSALEHFFIFHGIRHQICDLYDTKPCLTAPSLDGIDEIIFTSPSTVHAFSLHYPKAPSNISFRSLGPITAETLRLYISQ